MNKTFISTALVCATVLWLSTPAALGPGPDSSAIGKDLERFVAASELAVANEYGLVPGTSKRIRWFGNGEKTQYAIVSLHGFSATRQETAPLAKLVADALGANLFETRLAGHGRSRSALENVVAEDWLDDLVEAVHIASHLGEKTIIIGTSTGATLAAAMLDSAFMGTIDTVVMLSPNFAPRDQNAVWMTRPAGRLIAHWVIGRKRCWQPHNDLQALYWSTCYPTAAAVEMMRLVDRANHVLPAEVPQRILMFYSNDDRVVSPEAALAVLAATTAPQKAVIQISSPGDPSNHVLAGDVLSPASTDSIAGDIVEFILRPTP